MEEWRDVVGAERYYQVSDSGLIRNKLTRKVLKPSTSGGYKHIQLRYGINRDVLVHRIVAEAFIPNPFNFRCVNHIDENKSNNSVDNLEWCTYQYNCTYGKGALQRNSRVIQFDMAGNALTIWESIKDASENTDVTWQGISACCRGVRKSAGGYMWSYANLEDVRKYMMKLGGAICRD